MVKNVPRSGVPGEMEQEPGKYRTESRHRLIDQGQHLCKGHRRGKWHLQAGLIREAVQSAAVIPLLPPGGATQPVPSMPTAFPTLFVALLALALAGCNGEAPDTHPDQPVTKRRAVFKDMVRTLEPMGMVARERKDYQATEFLASALALQQLATRPWPLFTADSNYPPTHARPEVWTQAADFQLAQHTFTGRVDALVQAAQGQDLARIRAAVNDVQQSCKACHDSFRRKAAFD